MPWLINDDIVSSFWAFLKKLKPKIIEFIEGLYPLTPWCTISTDLYSSTHKTIALQATDITIYIKCKSWVVLSLFLRFPCKIFARAKQRMVIYFRRLIGLWNLMLHK